MGTKSRHRDGSSVIMTEEPSLCLHLCLQSDIDLDRT